MRRWMPLLSVIVAQVFFGVIVVRVPELSMWWQWSVIGAFAMACVASFIVGRITGQEREQVRSALLRFYAAYQTWLCSGAPNRSPFSRRHGLCVNLWDYCEDAGFPMWVIRASCVQLHKDFARAGRNAQLPFNADNMSYAAESYQQVCHENPARIAWVNDQLQQLTESM
ncbi:hypothetical protein N4I86_003027 [Escherichia coli]|nr:hypothetical protein [Escherichia coli]